MTYSPVCHKFGVVECAAGHYVSHPMTDTKHKPVHIIGGGLAGSEAAWQLARAGVATILHEMRPVRGTDAHQTSGLAELVCSNSFRSDDAEANAVGLLHEEMRRTDSLIMKAADANRVPAGSALAVDRDGVSAAVLYPIGIDLKGKNVGITFLTENL